MAPSGQGPLSSHGLSITRIVCVTSPAPNRTMGPIQVAIKGRPPGISTQYFTYQVSACPGYVPTPGDRSKKGQKASDIWVSTSNLTRGEQKELPLVQEGSHII